MRQVKDRTAKWLLSHHGDSILRLAGIRGFLSCRPAAAELVAPRRWPDGILEVQYPEGPDLVLVEIESYPDKDVDRQIAEDLEIVHLERGATPEVVCLILMPKGNLKAEGTATRRSKSGSTSVTATWPVVNLWEIDAESLLAENDPGLIPWVPLARTNRPRDEVLLECRDRLAAVPDSTDRSALLAVTAILAGLARNAKGLLNLFGGELMIESPVLDELKELMVRRERARVLIAILEARFGSVPAQLQTAVRAIEDSARLELLVRPAATCPDLAAFQAALAAPAS